MMTNRLWEPSQERIQNTNMYKFKSFINEKFQKQFTEYSHLYHWSIENIPEFWASMWEFAGIKASKPYDQIIDDQNLTGLATNSKEFNLNFVIKISIRGNLDFICLVRAVHVLSSEWSPVPIQDRSNGCL